MQIPIACSLASTDIPGRIEEWRQFFHDSVERVERSGCTVRLGLARSGQILAAAASLAEREQECCPFFEFALLLEAGQWWLKVSVPSDAGATLDDVLTLLPDRLAR